MLEILAGEGSQFRVVICGKLDNVSWENLQCFQKLSHLMLSNKYMCSGSVQSAAVLMRRDCRGEASYFLFVERSIFFSPDSQRGDKFGGKVMRAWIELCEKGNSTDKRF